eukprot:CAMPEP_0177595874 /NCGR_PEP_ID=MMETSP0419_2-20121207/10643_1 /TAXON_ID=582737 /ORGANISM="Tetraselmis sp., Strain GSL018" /LENGTH=76 /DNA_ID=CAMNT_0019087471 /DNA_START=140 /DNA_END=366 /DNA_ORIENTATION=+
MASATKLSRDQVLHHILKNMRSIFNGQRPDEEIVRFSKHIEEKAYTMSKTPADYMKIIKQNLEQARHQIKSNGGAA